MDDDLFQPPATAEQLAEKGIRESHEHAEQANDDWTARAVEKVREFAKDNDYFLAERVKAWAYEDGLDVPPVDGSWGQVMRNAAKLGIIHAFGRAAATSPGSHGKLMTLWRRGPGNIAAPAVTQEQIEEEIRFLTDTRDVMRKEGRSFLWPRFDQTIELIRALASDL